MENVQRMSTYMGLRQTEAGYTTPVYTRGILHPASHRILLLRRHPQHHNNKCYIETAQQQWQYKSLCSDFSACQNYTITPWKQIKQHQPDCWDCFISNAVLFHKECIASGLSGKVNNGFSICVKPNLWSGVEPKRTFLNPTPLLPDIYIGRNNKIIIIIKPIIYSFQFICSPHSFQAGIWEEAPKCELSTYTLFRMHTRSIRCLLIAQRKHSLQDTIWKRRFCWYIRFI